MACRKSTKITVVFFLKRLRGYVGCKYVHPTFLVWNILIFIENPFLTKGVYAPGAKTPCLWSVVFLPFLLAIFIFMFLIEKNKQHVNTIKSISKLSMFVSVFDYHIVWGGWKKRKIYATLDALRDYKFTSFTRQILNKVHEIFPIIIFN
jgi:hypothetical protein